MKRFTGKKNNKSAKFIPEIIKSSSDKTHQQNCTSKLILLGYHVDHVIIGT